MTYSGLVLLAIASVIGLAIGLVLLIVERDETRGTCRRCGLRDATPGYPDGLCSECAADEPEWQLPPLRMRG